MNHIPFKSGELNNASDVSPNQLQQSTTNSNLQQIEHDILSFLVQKDHTLYRHFSEGKAHARISINADEFMVSILDEFRRHIHKRCLDVESTYKINAPMVDKIFSIIKMNLELLKSLNIPYQRTELIAAVQGNLLKHMI